jgi:hypothetical protein
MLINCKHLKESRCQTILEVNFTICIISFTDELYIKTVYYILLRQVFILHEAIQQTRNITQFVWSCVSFDKQNPKYNLKYMFSINICCTCILPRHHCCILSTPALISHQNVKPHINNDLLQMHLPIRMSCICYFTHIVMICVFSCQII